MELSLGFLVSDMKIFLEFGSWGSNCRSIFFFFYGVGAKQIIWMNN